MQGTTHDASQNPHTYILLCTSTDTAASSAQHKLFYQSITREALRVTARQTASSHKSHNNPSVVLNFSPTEGHDLRNFVVHDGTIVAIRPFFKSLLKSLIWVAPDFQGTLGWSGGNPLHFITRHSQLLPQSPGASPRPCHLPLHTTGAIMIEMALIPLIATSLRYQPGSWPYLLSSPSQNRLH